MPISQKLLLQDSFPQFDAKKWLYFSNEKAEIIVSGLIYNWFEISASAAPFSAEAFLSLYLEKRESVFEKINGKFSVIIALENELVAFRDQWGEGPLVFYSGNQFADSMENAISLVDKGLELNPVALKSFMMYGFIPAPLTIVQGLSLIPSGHILRMDKNGEVLIHLFDYKEFKSEVIAISKEEALEEYGRLLKQSINRRIGKNETVGALLSGGYDSGGNIAVLREVFSGEIKSYSIGFKDNPFSELPYAKLMAEKFGAEHHEYLMAQPDVEFLPDAIRAFGQPFAESGFMLNNAAMRMVKDENLPVVIGGDGNDQLFGTTGKELALQHILRKSGLVVFQKMFKTLSSNNLFEKDNILYKVRFHNFKILNAMMPDNFGFNQSMLNDLFKLKNVGVHPVFLETPKTYSDFTELHNLHNLYLDIRHSINEVILNKASRLSAYYDVNLAFTYLDKDIYNFIKKLPLDLRLAGSVKDLAKARGVTKLLHKQFTKPKLPTDVTSRKKQGGFSPLEIFFKDESYRKRIYGYISKSDFVSNYMKKDALKSFMDSFESSMNSNGYWFWYKQLKSNQMISLLIMVLWWDIFVNKKSFQRLSDYLNS